MRKALYGCAAYVVAFGMAHAQTLPDTPVAASTPATTAPPVAKAAPVSFSAAIVRPAPADSPAAPAAAAAPVAAAPVAAAPVAAAPVVAAPVVAAPAAAAAAPPAAAPSVAATPVAANLPARSPVVWPQPQPVANAVLRNLVLDNPRVITTARLQAGDTAVTLYGLDGLDGDAAQTLATYLAGQRLTCQPVESAGFNCQLPDGTDIAQAALLNGAAKAAEDAPDSYRALETQAQEARRGLWTDVSLLPPVPLAHPTVQDTATLVTDQKTVTLEGLQGLGQPYAEDLQQYIATSGDRVVCLAQATAGHYVCTTNDATDLAKVALVNGAAVAAPGAPADYIAQQQDAIANRRGVWANAPAEATYTVAADGITYADGAPIAWVEGQPAVLTYTDGGWGYYDSVSHWHAAPAVYVGHLSHAVAYSAHRGLAFGHGEGGGGRGGHDGAAGGRSNGAGFRGQGHAGNGMGRSSVPGSHQGGMGAPFGSNRHGGAGAGAGNPMSGHANAGQFNHGGGFGRGTGGPMNVSHNGGGNVRHANFGQANFGHANMGHANMGHANMGHANMGHANMGHANIGRANSGHASGGFGHRTRG